MGMDYMIWQEMFGSGAVIYIISNHTVSQLKKDSLLIQKGHPIHLIRMNRTCQNESCGADLIYAMIAIAAATVFPSG